MDPAATAAIAYARLVIAAEAGDVAELRYALRDGADPDFSGAHSMVHRRRPLYVATSYGHCEIVSILIESGASVHGLKHIDEDGYTALHMAANSQRLDILSLLVAAGADVHRGLTNDVGEIYVRGTTALDMLLYAPHFKAGFSYTMSSPLASHIRVLAQAGAMPSPGFNWEIPQSHMPDNPVELKRKRAVNERWRAYFAKLAQAGGFDAHARDERQKLVVIADKFLGLDLAPQVIPIIVDFWGHPGDPALCVSDLPARGGPPL